MESGRLYVHGVEVSVVYFRAGYTPRDYEGEVEWEGRKKLEEAWRCVKCPSLAYQLAGCKIVQQRLCEEGQVERFMHEEEALSLRACFTEMYSLSRRGSLCFSLEVGDAVFRAMNQPEAWVIKPQREGGGNNYFNEAVRDKLRNGVNELDSLILMSRITPMPQPAILVNRERPLYVNTVSELGIYGTFLTTSDVEIGPSMNKAGKGAVRINGHAGHLLRTKKVGVDEGGVATGYSVLSSPLLA